MGLGKALLNATKPESGNNENYSSVPVETNDEPDMRTGVRYGNKKAEIQSVELLDSNGFPRFSYKTCDEIILRYRMIAHRDFNNDLTIGFIIRNKFTQILRKSQYPMRKW